MKTMSADKSLQREFFEFDVKITEGKFGKTAKWENYKHPESDHFQQIVNWFAYENGDKSKIIIRYSLDKQLNKIYDHAVIDHTGNFDEAVFDFWKREMI